MAHRTPRFPDEENERAPIASLADAYDAFHDATSRRAFLRRASALTLAVPGLGAALTACSPEQKQAAPATAHPSRPLAGAHESVRIRNPDSKLDTALHHVPPHAATTSTSAPNPLSTPFVRCDPALPALAAGHSLDVHFHAREAPIRISTDTVVAGWTFEGNIPGPFLHCRVGDEVHFTLTNESVVPHSMDFHAAQINPKAAFRSVIRGASVSYSFKPRYAGAFLYHCGTAPVLMHLGSGMFGAIIVSPREPLPQAREFVLIQNEFYLGAPVNGVHPFDYNRMLSAPPDAVAFNGRPDQYSREPIHVKVGDRVRFWVVAAGPTLPCAFHIVGEQFDTVYIGAPPNERIRGIQTWNVPPGGGMCFELTCDVPGEFPFVNHAFGHGQKGAIGYLVVEA